MDQSNQICGIDQSLVEQFLYLVRDNYRKAERALFFLEERGHVNYTAPIANLRDVLSHLASMLDPATPDANRRAQLENADEHLRRAILEPYMIVVGRERKVFMALYEQYEQDLWPVKRNYPSLASAPDPGYIEAQLHRIADLVAQGRAAKAMNLWNPEWERGVSALIEANTILANLHQQVREHWNELKRILSDDKLRVELADLRGRFERQSILLTEQRGSTSPYSTLMIRVLHLAERGLRKSIHVHPDKEVDIQNAFETLLVGAGIKYARETDHLSYSSKVYIPDFTAPDLDLAIEIKLCSRQGRMQEIIAEINDDILA